MPSECPVSKHWLLATPQSASLPSVPAIMLMRVQIRLIHTIQPSMRVAANQSPMLRAEL